MSWSDELREAKQAADSVKLLMGSKEMLTLSQTDPQVVSLIPQLCKARTRILLSRNHGISAFLCMKDNIITLKNAQA